MVQGLSNKQIAARIDVAPRTVEMHRAKLMQKLGVRNLAETMQRVLQGPQLAGALAFRTSGP